MIHDSIEFHNVTELVEVDQFDTLTTGGQQGLRLQRVPQSVRAHLDEGTAGTMLSPSGSELRFRIADGCDAATITLSAELPTTIYVYHGPFQGGIFELGKEPKELKIVPPKRLVELTKEEYPGATYDPALVRLCFGEAYPEPVFYHGHSGGIEPPRAGDVPETVYLAYGSSITHGTGLSGATLSYPAHVAWRLGVDLRNLGASGCCLCEPAMADFLAEQPCDLVTLELSVNMLGRGFTAAELKERAGYLVQRVADADPNRPVVCITIFPHFRDVNERYCGGTEKATPAEYRQVLRDIVSDLNRPNVTLVEGPDLLSDLGGLSADLIHPGARGALLIGDELASRLKELLGRGE